MRTEPEEIGDAGQDCATLEEARNAVANLTSTDHVKLVLIARYFARRRLRDTVMEAEDLLHDAIVKTLDGSRRWNKRFSIIKHLDRVMESDSGHAARRRADHGGVSIAEMESEPVALAQGLPDSLFAAEQCDQALELFADDKLALDLLRHKADGLSASEIEREMGIGKMQYETVTKRIRRQVSRYLA